jgi:periplasmic divalent cation tolerance protein
MSAAVVVFVTAPTAREARLLAETLVKEKLAACASVLPGLRSVYRWKGKVESASESLLLIKTRRSRLTALTRRVKALHPYEVPEIVACPVVGGNPDYLRWVEESTRGSAVPGNPPEKNC